MPSSPLPPPKTIQDRWNALKHSITGTWNTLFPARVQKTPVRSSHLFQLILQVILWLAFGAFLFASLPHVAYFFASFEPQDAHGNINDYWWFVSYALAVSIDVTAFLLSLNVAVKMRRATAGLVWYQKLGPALGVVLTHWPFILLLVGFSWLVNFEHAKVFHSTMLEAAEVVHINLWFWKGTLGDLNPVIASAFPVLAVAYTGMADRIGDERRAAEMLPQEAIPSPSVTGTTAEQQPDTPDFEKLLETVVTMNQQTLQAMQAMNQQTMHVTVEQVTRVTVEAVREAVGQVVEALPGYNPPQLEAPRKEGSSGNSTNAHEGRKRVVGFHESPYGDQIEALYQENPAITVAEIVQRVGCSKPIAMKWLGRVRVNPVVEQKLSDTE